MHLLVREQVSVDEEAGAVDLGLPPADLVFLSFSDGDLAAVERAGRREGIDVRAVGLSRLAHPMSVDLFAEATVPGSGAVVLRLLGGLDRWRYGAEEFSEACRRAGVPLAICGGPEAEDPRLRALSTAGADACRRLDAMLREGGAENAARVVRLGATLGRRGPPAHEEALVLPANGLHDFGAAPCATPVGHAAIVFYRSHLHAGDLAGLTALAASLAARGIAAEGVFADSLKSPATARHVAALLGRVRPDIVLNATAFASRDADGASPLDAAGCPVLQLTQAGGDEAGWRASPRGLAPADLAMSVVLPELDGRLATPLLACKTEGADGRRFAAVAGGADAVADRAAGWVRLRRTPAAERRIAIVLSDYPGAAGTSHARGYAVGLDTFASLAAILDLLVDAGYTAARRDADALARALRDLPPGETLTLGRVQVALQPPRSESADADGRAGYHDAALAPSPAYRDFYRALAGSADAILHLGTHGTLEWLPGKAAALSSNCWPTILTGGLPVIYPFIVSNPGEAAVAKRRLGAVTIGHLTPPLVRATLNGEAAEVERLLDELAEADGLDRRRASLLRRAVLERAGDAGLLAEAGADDTDEADALARLDSHLCDIKELRIGDGLHVFSRPPHARDTLLEALGGDMHGAALDACAPGEARALLAALDGRFVPPGPAGAPSRGRADVLPTGRNLTAIDPRQAPTPSAFALARRNADLLLRRHEQDSGEALAHLVLDLWGSATLRTGGEDLALAFVLLGVEPVHDEAGRLAGLSVLSIAELGRPRVDVTLRISGVFRDNFAGQIALFDRAVRLVAERREEGRDNPVAAAPPGARVFGPAPGGYGVAAEAWVESSAWSYGAGDDARHDAAGLAARVDAADAFLHHGDHRETDILDGPEHAAHAGGFAQAAQEAGRAPAIYHADIAGNVPRIRTAREEIVRVVRGRLANEQWLGGMRRHGMRGASEMARGVEALALFAQSLPDRFDGQFDLVHAALLADGENACFLADANPQALAAITRTLDAERTAGRWRPRRNDIGPLA